MVVDGRWLVAGGWWQVAGGWWLVGRWAEAWLMWNRGLVDMGTGGHQNPTYGPTRPGANSSTPAAPSRKRRT